MIKQQEGQKRANEKWEREQEEARERQQGNQKWKGGKGDKGGKGGKGKGKTWQNDKDYYNQRPRSPIRAAQKRQRADDADDDAEAGRGPMQVLHFL